ncbi:hypothetical protein Cantr_05016 [Candida viswanathii]|uniref:Uncharacterized protein n=1 Tax=Candida viswanathii TaxID=5486 RepID=A0A367XRH1_9ASCO|nr:hypothetical protein Cantr_05016 [Candida viswanathii]
MVEYEIDVPVGGLSVSYLWSYLMTTNANFSKALTVRLSQIAGYIYNPEYKHRFVQYNKRFMERTYDPTVDFLVKIDHVAMGNKYYMATTECVVETFVLVVNQFYKEWMTDPSRDVPTIEAIMEAFKDHPGYKPKALSRFETTRSIGAFIKNDTMKRKLRNAKMNEKGTLNQRPGAATLGRY